MKRLFLGCLMVCLALGFTHAADMRTVAEQSGFQRTSSYQDVIDFLVAMESISPVVTLATLTRSIEGRIIPLVILSSEGQRSHRELSTSGKPVVLITANIHAGEVEGKEACLMLIRDLVQGRESRILEKQVILVVPIFNADGNDKFGPNRHDNGPELAGVRYNGQFLDLNRDFLKLESPEVRSLVRLINEWDPVLFVDLHTTNGSYHREPVTYSTMTHPNTAMELRHFMWRTFLSASSDMLRQSHGYDSVPYGNFSDRFTPQKGWENWAVAARFGFNYMGLRNRFTVLNENYSHADFRTRVLSCHAFLKSVLQVSNRHIETMANMVKEADRATVNELPQQSLALTYTLDRLFDIDLKSYRFKKVKIKPEERHKYPPWYGDHRVEKTEDLVTYRLPYLAEAKPTASVPIPEAYIIPPYHKEVVNLLRRHGIILQRIQSDVRLTVERYTFSEIKPGDRIYQGHILLECITAVETLETDVPAGSTYVSVRQPLGRLIPILLEPQSDDSLLAWGFFNREIVSQWTGQPRPYPVFRLPHRPKVLSLWLDTDGGE